MLFIAKPQTKSLLLSICLRELLHHLEFLERDCIPEEEKAFLQWREVSFCSVGSRERASAFDVLFFVGFVWGFLPLRITDVVIAEAGRFIIPFLSFLRNYYYDRRYLYPYFHYDHRFKMTSYHLRIYTLLGYRSGAPAGNIPGASVH